MPDQTAVIPSVVREVVVAAPVDTCFRVFVDGWETWWPAEHHIGEGRTIVHFAVEPHVGGRCYDVDTDGFECQWGTVLAYDPPERLVFAWHIQGDWQVDLDPERQSEVEVTFAALDEGRTAVRMEHRNLDRHGEGGHSVRQGVDSGGGWPWILDRYADRVEGRDPRPHPTPPAALPAGLE